MTNYEERVEIQSSNRYNGIEGRESWLTNIYRNRILALITVKVLTFDGLARMNGQIMNTGSSCERAIGLKQRTFIYGSAATRRHVRLRKIVKERWLIREELCFKIKIICRIYTLLG